MNDQNDFNDLNLYNIIIIIGLPGSGKTTFANFLNIKLNFLIFDDYLQTYYDGKLLNSLKNVFFLLNF